MEQKKLTIPVGNGKEVHILIEIVDVNKYSHPPQSDEKNIPEPGAYDCPPEWVLKVFEFFENYGFYQDECIRYLNSKLGIGEDPRFWDERNKKDIRAVSIELKAMSPLDRALAVKGASDVR